MKWWSDGETAAEASPAVDGSAGQDAGSVASVEGTGAEGQTGDAGTEGQPQKEAEDTTAGTPKESSAKPNPALTKAGAQGNTALKKAAAPALKAEGKLAATIGVKPSSMVPRGLVSRPTLMWIGVAVLLVLLVVLGVRWYRNARRKPTDQKPPGLSRRSLWLTFKRFRAAQPPRVQAGLETLPLVIVMGGAGSGKTHLIEELLGVEGNARQLRPPDTADPLLQWYMGEDMAALELSSALLHDTSPATIRALQHLSSRLVRHRNPVVLLVVDAQVLLHGDAEEPRRLAQLVRGKIDLLSVAARMPVEVRVCLTHLDRLPGYAELGQVLCARGLDRGFPLAPLATPQGVAATLAALDGLLNDGLQMLPLAGFHSLVAMVAELEKLLAVTGGMAATLSQPVQHTAAPALERLTCYAGRPGTLLGEPLRRPVERLAAGLTPRQQRRHLLAAAGVLLLCMTPLIVAYAVNIARIGAALQATTVFLEEGLRIEVDLTTVDRISRLPAQPASRGVALQSLEDLKRFEGRLPMLAHTFQPDRAIIRSNISGAIRTAYLQPLLKLGPGTGDGQIAAEMALYVLSLIYASNEPDNAFGRLIRRSPEEWAAATDVERQVIDLYLENTDHGRTMPLTFVLPDFGMYRAENALDDLSYWTRYFDYVETVQSQAVPEPIPDWFLQASEEIARIAKDLDWFPQVERLFGLLNLPGAPSAIEVKDAFWIEGQFLSVPQEIFRQRRSVGAISRSVLNLSYVSTTGSGVARKEVPETLTALLQQIELASRAGDPASAPVQVSLQGRTWTFDPSLWGHHEASRRLKSTVSSFMRSYRGFFTREELEAARIRYESSAEGYNPLYTREAVRNTVQPALVRADEVLRSPMLDEETQAALADYIDQVVRGYSARYHDSLLERFHRYSMTRGRRIVHYVDLLGCLEALLKPTSPQLMMLRGLARDADVAPPPDNPWLPVLSDQLAPFQPLVQLMAEQDGAVPAMMPYLALIRQMREALAERSAPPSRPGSPEAPDRSTLVDHLTPEGRASLAMLRKDPDAYDNLLRQWLATSSLLGDMQAPFREPVDALRALGLEDLRRTAQQLWTHHLEPEASALLGLFPFAVHGSRAVTAESLIAALGPQGTFWDAYGRLLEPLSLSVGGYQVGRFAEVSVPPGALATVNRFRRTARLLLDEKGVPRPIRLEALVLPLPEETTEHGRPVRAMLQVGEQTTVGFNQQPSWEPLEVEWWSPGTASMQVKYGRPGAEAVRDDRLSRSRLLWSLHRLLADPSMHFDVLQSSDAQIPGPLRQVLSANNVRQVYLVSWLTPTTAAGRPQYIRVLFRENPWAALH